MREIVRIELLTAGGCGRCVQVRARLKQVIESIDDARLELREVDVIEQIDYAVKLGVLSTPAVAINGDLIFSGPASADNLRKVIAERLA